MEDPNYPTAEQVSKDYDFTGKTAIVTGANVGIGKETARVLVLRNCHVIMACRSLERGHEARNDIITSVGANKAHLLEVMELDLTSLASVRKFAQAYQSRGELPSLHLLINNAGIMSLIDRQVTQDGYEGHFGINHLAHFLLSLLLLPFLKASAPSRILFVSSEAHRFAPRNIPIDHDPKTLFPENPEGGGGYQGNAAYGLSKMYNVMCAYEMNRRLKGTHVVCSSLHPGIIITNLGRDFPPEMYKEQVESVANRAKAPVLTIPQGAATTLFAAGSPEGGKEEGGYFRNVALASARSDGNDPLLTEALWKFSESLIAPYLSKL